METEKQDEEELSEQQDRFCEYILFDNQVNAYMKAYPDCTYDSAATSASRLLRNAKIQERITFLKNDIENITGVSKIRNIKELANIAYSSIACLHDSWIELKAYEGLTEDQKAAIESIEYKTEDKIREGVKVSEIVFVKIKMYPKIAAIQEINKVMDYCKATKIELSGAVNIDPKSWAKE